MYTQPESMDPERLARDALTAIDVLGELGDDIGLSRSWSLLGEARWMTGRLAEAAENYEHAAEHARRALSRRDEAWALGAQAMALHYGPMPVTEGLRKTEGMLRDAEGDLVLEANLLGFLASFEAMEGRIEEARAHIVESAERLNDLGLRWQAGVQELLRGYIELLAGDPVAADRFMRAAKESFIAIGDKLFLSSVAVDLPRPALERGRHDEARALVDAIEEVPAVEIEWVIKRASVRARILAIDGKTDEAESLAREAVAIAAETDLLNFHAGALIDLAEVLRGAGRLKQAGNAAGEALVLYERKGNVMSAAKTRALVAELEGAGG